MTLHRGISRTLVAILTGVCLTALTLPPAASAQPWDILWQQQMAEPGSHVNANQIAIQHGGEAPGSANTEILLGVAKRYQTAWIARYSPDGEFLGRQFLDGDHTFRVSLAEVGDDIVAGTGKAVADKWSSETLACFTRFSHAGPHPEELWQTGDLAWLRNASPRRIVPLPANSGEGSALTMGSGGISMYDSRYYFTVVGADGSLDAHWHYTVAGGGIVGPVIDEDGGVYIGTYYQNDGGSGFGIVRYSTSGALHWWLDLGDELDTYYRPVKGISVVPQGVVLLTSDWETSFLTMFTPDGTILWDHPSPVPYPRALLPLDDGTFIIAAIGTDDLNSEWTRLYHVDSMGNILNSTPTVAMQWVEDLVHGPDGMILVSGVDNTGEHQSGRLAAFADPTTLGVADDGASAAVRPTRLELLPAYPNPFNRWVRLGFTVPEQTNVRVSIHDILGRPVSVLADGLHQPGTHRLIWSAEEVPTGTYIVRAQSGDNVHSRRIILLK